jgi:putative flippase GtrA
LENTALSKQTISFGFSLAVCAVLNAFFVIAKEKNKAVADWMQRLTGHHWITHAGIILILYFILGLCFGGTKGGQASKLPANRLTNVVLSGVIAGVLIILGFYLISD